MPAKMSHVLAYRRDRLHTSLDPQQFKQKQQEHYDWARRIELRWSAEALAHDDPARVERLLREAFRDVKEYFLTNHLSEMEVTAYYDNQEFDLAAALHFAAPLWDQLSDEEQIEWRRHFNVLLPARAGCDVSELTVYEPDRRHSTLKAAFANDRTPLGPAMLAALPEYHAPAASTASPEYEPALPPLLPAGPAARGGTAYQQMAMPQQTRFRSSTALSIIDPVMGAPSQQSLQSQDAYPKEVKVEREESLPYHPQMDAQQQFVLPQDAIVKWGATPTAKAVGVLVYLGKVTKAEVKIALARIVNPKTRVGLVSLKGMHMITSPHLKHARPANLQLLSIKGHSSRMILRSPSTPDIFIAKLAAITSLDMIPALASLQTPRFILRAAPASNGPNVFVVTFERALRTSSFTVNTVQGRNHTRCVMTFSRKDVAAVACCVCHGNHPVTQCRRLVVVPAPTYGEPKYLAVVPL